MFEIALWRRVLDTLEIPLVSSRKLLKRPGFFTACDDSEKKARRKGIAKCAEKT
jgi:hypothetical protein